MGIESIHDIPDDFELSEIQRRAAACVQTGEPWFSPEVCGIGRAGVPALLHGL